MDAAGRQVQRRAAPVILYGMLLFNYALSSASYRVRIGLALKRVAYDAVPMNLREGQHQLPDYMGINSQGFVPALQLDDGAVLTQSLAILEYLDEQFPEPALLPSNPLDRARVRAVAQMICCDIHPLNNLRVLRYLQNDLQMDKAARDVWYEHWIHAGFSALESRLAGAIGGPFAFGATVTLADVCIVPQVFNARRFNVNLADFPRIVDIDAACREIDAFQSAAPS